MSGRTAVIYQAGERVVAVDPADRGLAYGDGLFETMRAHRGELPWWDAHWARLALGAARLNLPLPDPEQVLDGARMLLDGDDGVFKLLLTRGAGGRGYAPPTPAVPTLVLSRHPLPPPAPEPGLNVRWCEIRLSLQPRLAGLKHCNRLEQVLARAEWSDPGVHEGLLRSVEGDAVGATAANLFVLREGRWRTPAVDRCGVAGVCRGWVLDALDVLETRLDVTDVETADAVFLCNAVRGILPVARLGTRHWADATPGHRQVTDLQARLAAAHPAFAMENL
ncbi:aminodeoxychorismate lyase [Marilutibacter chinensis]|uniref:Aminodeoxychorismate lyase n=1 Tax=Marilutibacter chinensis TaxID=2912247 RepID=A0ABS9HX79_9GAMM|nr:aminodeoxychorismate lyase [Lysobacter chinensis]MCF7223486.1 aminodeoxychorismate lyase [Lysobacter chinensis]